MKIRIVFFLIAALLIGCSTKKELTPEERAAYETEINEWHKTRIENVSAPEGWINLVGLYWLQQGPNTFGSDEKNAIVFPEGKIAASAGYFLVQGDVVSIYVNKDVNITSSGKTVTQQVIFHPDSSGSISLDAGSLQWNIIKRDDKIGIRLRDLESEAQKAFKGIERYAIDAEYRVPARFEKADSTRTINITNVLGQTNPQLSPGTLVFDLNGVENRLDVLKGGKDEFFVLFADKTSGHETYAGGRFLAVKKPVGEDQTTFIDFNKAYNPPCVFTPYATCPLPPKQNQLSIEIKAGEKNYGHHEQAL